MYYSSKSSYSEPTNCIAQIDQPQYLLFLCHLECVNKIFFGVQWCRKAMYLAYFSAYEGEERLSFVVSPLPDDLETPSKHIHDVFIYSCNIFIEGISV